MKNRSRQRNCYVYPVVLPYVCIVVLLIAGHSCDYFDPVNPQPENLPVFVSGYYNNGSVDIACYWIHGEKTDLPADENSYGRSIYVDGTDIYVAGFTTPDHNMYTACYWKNGKRTDLPGITGERSQAYSVKVVKSDVYIGGKYHDGSKYNACYWENDVRHDVSSGVSASVNCMNMKGTDIYLGGGILSGVNFAGYWKNDEYHELEGSVNSLVHSISVSGASVYACGMTNNGGSSGYWIDDGGTVRWVALGTGYSFEDIVAVNGDVFCTGYYEDGESNTYARYFRNDQLIDLFPDLSYSETHAICIAGSDVYVAGCYYREPCMTVCYWKNNTCVDVYSSDMYFADAYSIFVP
jgi:hypothetical protein